MKKLSIKLRITIWYTLIIVLISAAVLSVMTSLSRKMITQESTSKIIRYVTNLSHRVGTPPDKPDGGTDGGNGSTPEKPPALPENTAEPEETPKADGGGDSAPRDKRDDNMSAPNFFEDGVHMAVYDATHTLVEGFMPFEFADEITLADNDLEERVYNGSKYLTYTKQITTKDGADQWIVGVVSIDDESNMLRNVVKTNLILTVILIAAAAAGGYLIMKRAFAPVEKIRKTADDISRSSDLSQRIALGEGSDEIYRLGETFDRMLEKIETTLENEKQFTSDASHELRTPVAVITSECEYALECADSPEDMTESITAIKRQSDKMSKLISELLTISRMDRNTQVSEFEDVNISEMLGFICDEQEEIHQGGIKLIRSIAPDVTASADRMLLMRLFVNLISNAYQYGRENGKTVVTLEDNGDTVTAVVEDDGIGISEEVLPRIWERFYRADAARSSENGSMGLGLAMVKQIAGHHNGTVTVRSVPDKGTAFTFTMPKKHG